MDNKVFQLSLYSFTLLQEELVTSQVSKLQLLSHIQPTSFCEESFIEIQPCPFIYNCHGSVPITELSSYPSDIMTHKAKNIDYLALNGKSFSTPESHQTLF